MCGVILSEFSNSSGQTLDDLILHQVRNFFAS